MYPLESAFLYPLGHYLGEQWLDHVVVQWFTFWGTPTLSPRLAVPVYIPTNRMGGFPLEAGHYLPAIS